MHENTCGNTWKFKVFFNQIKNTWYTWNMENTSQSVLISSKEGHAECMNMQYLHEFRSKTVLNTWPSIRDVPHG